MHMSAACWMPWLLRVWVGGAVVGLALALHGSGAELLKPAMAMDPAAPPALEALLGVYRSSWCDGSESGAGSCTTLITPLCTKH